VEVIKRSNLVNSADKDRHSASPLCSYQMLFMLLGWSRDYRKPGYDMIGDTTAGNFLLVLPS